MNYADYITKLLPVFLQKERFIAWVSALVSPLQTLHDLYVNYAQTVRYRLSLTGQVIYLEHYLNDLFDNSQRRIYIEDASELLLPPYLYNKPTPHGTQIYIKNKSEGGDKFYLRNRAEYNNQANFIVWVPAELEPQNAEHLFRAAVNRYKQAGAIYSIQTIQ